MAEKEDNKTKSETNKTEESNESIIQKLKCARSDDFHIVHDPLVIDCNHLCCRKCLVSKENEIKNCCHCFKPIDTNKFTEINPKELFEELFESKIDDLFRRLREEANANLQSLKGKNINFYT